LAGSLRRIESSLLYVAEILRISVSRSRCASGRGMPRRSSVNGPWWLTAAILLLSIPFPSVEAQERKVDLPVIDPQYSIAVFGTEMAREERGSYHVLAFAGQCRIEQGGFRGTADEIVLWIEKNGPTEVDVPGKVICYLRGNAVARWPDGSELRDRQWLGRLFSMHAVETSSERRVQRFDIPHLNWEIESPSSVQLAQFNQRFNQPTERGGEGPDPLLLPLLQPPSSNVAVPSASRVPSIPGAMQWDPGSGERSREQGNRQSTSGLPALPASTPTGREGSLLPSGGLVLSTDGSPPRAFQSAEALPAPAPSNLEIAPPYPLLNEPQVSFQVPVASASPFGAKSVQFFQRSANTNITFLPDATTGENVAQIRGGFRLIVRGIQVPQSDGSVVEVGNVSLEADNAVMWIRGAGTVQDLFGGFTSTPETPIELYLEGNIVFAQGNRVIYAERMYYNISSEYGMVLSAEVLTPVPRYQGLLRLKADVLQQRDRQHFSAYGAAITSSRLGVPRYWLQANEATFADERGEAETSFFSPSGTGRPSEMRATARNNFVYLGGVPVGYWPAFSTNLTEPSIYLTSLRFNNDTIFGTQVYATWDPYQLLGMRQPDGTRWRVSTDYLSERGPALGSNFTYDRPTWLFGIPGTGFWDAWFIYDEGRDTLGAGRVNLEPEATLRGRTVSRNRLFVTPNVELMLESGYISDRNFLEQYFEREWDTEKDIETALRLRSYNQNRQLEIFGKYRVNDFFTETEWLPRLDHYWLGQDLMGERFTWSQHTSVGYGHVRPATTPRNPIDASQFALLPWETDSEGLRAITRQELSMPLELGVWQVVPFLSGEAGFWNEDVNQQEVTRLTGQAGVRTALPFWQLYPNVENRLLDLRGIAHKVTWKNEFFYADTTQNLDRFPLYDPLDDNSQEHFRRRFIFNTFGGTLPEQFDERNFAVRSGMQRWVSASSSEIVEDMMQVRTGLNQRWQTKRGLPGRERIVDVVSFDADLIYFPKAERDNFGEDVGAINYDFRYHVGDRLTLLSDGYFDVFSQGLKAVSAGAKISRPGRGDAYLGILSIEGPISANVLNGFVNYRMNEKWIFSSGAAFDFGEVGSIGQTIGLTRVGESALLRMGVVVDHGRDNVSFNFSLEPRFLPTIGLGALSGELIPPAGMFGVE
jgi:hypothetical protein